MERGTSRIPKGSEGNTQNIRTRASHNLPSRCSNPQKTEKLCQKRPPTGVSHYWIYITTTQSPKKDRRDLPYVYSVLTALHSAFFPKVAQMRYHHSKQMDSETRREIDRRLSITQAQTPTGTTFQFMNMYQFTAANPMG